MLASRGGQVEAQVAESGPWTAVEQTQELREGVVLRTSGGPATLALFEGSTLNMEPGAEIRLMMLRSGLRGASYRILIEQESGSVDYAVAALRGKISIFEVHLPSVRATVSVLGTRFGIVADADGVVHISVTEGYVQVASDRDHLVLQAGEELTIREAGRLIMAMESLACSDLAPTAQAFELAGQEVLPTPSMDPKPSVAPKTARIVLPTATLTLETPVERSVPETGQRGENYPEPDMSAPDEWPTPTMTPSQMAIAPLQGESVYVAAPAKEEPPHTCTPAPQPSRTPLPSPTAEPSATNEPTATCSPTLTPTAEPSATLVPPNTATPTR
ncbi:MAG: FecR domain-containing protein, partial [Anaerolineae bacterium]|nr:FecR domain-containing protein [Anaerolineae bacterium]